MCKIYKITVNNKPLYRDGNVGRERERFANATYEYLYRPTPLGYDLCFTEKGYYKFKRQIDRYLRYCKKLGQQTEIQCICLEISNLYLEKYSDDYKRVIKFGKFAE